MKRELKETFLPVTLKSRQHSAALSRLLLPFDISKPRLKHLWWRALCPQERLPPIRWKGCVRQAGGAIKQISLCHITPSLSGLMGDGAWGGVLRGGRKAHLIELTCHYLGVNTLHMNMHIVCICVCVCARVHAQPAYLLLPGFLQIVRQLQGQYDTKNELQNSKESQKFSI